MYAIPNASCNYRIESKYCGSGMFELVLASLPIKMLYLKAFALSCLGFGENENS